MTVFAGLFANGRRSTVLGAFGGVTIIISRISNLVLNLLY